MTLAMNNLRLRLVAAMWQRRYTALMIVPRFGHCAASVTSLWQRPGLAEPLSVLTTLSAPPWLSGSARLPGLRACGSLPWTRWSQSCRRTALRQLPTTIKIGKLSKRTVPYGTVLWLFGSPLGFRRRCFWNYPSVVASYIRVAAGWLLL